MTTNTYQALCDDVGAYDEVEIHRPDDEVYWGNFESSTDFFDTDKNYHPQRAEQRERLLLLIARAKKNYSNTFMVQAFGENLHLTADEQLGDGYSFPAEYEVKGENYPEALYALTHKLVKEGVLSKEEVKEALSGN